VFAEPAARSVFEVLRSSDEPWSSFDVLWFSVEPWSPFDVLRFSVEDFGFLMIWH
jgi:hypothetical protein